MNRETDKREDVNVLNDELILTRRMLKVDARSRAVEPDPWWLALGKQGYRKRDWARMPSMRLLHACSCMMRDPSLILAMEGWPTNYPQFVVPQMCRHGLYLPLHTTGAQVLLLADVDLQDAI